MITLLSDLLEAAVPELAGRISPSAVDDQTPTPYALVVSKEDSLQTKDSLAGMRRTVEVRLYEKSLSPLEDLKSAVLEALEGESVADRIVTYQAGECAFVPEWQVHGYTLTFNLK